MAASTARRERGSNRDRRRATMRARSEGTNRRSLLCAPGCARRAASCHFAACSSAAAASFTNSSLFLGSGSAAATRRYSQADSFSWYQLSRPDAVNIHPVLRRRRPRRRSEEHTSELQSHLNIVCRLLLEKKKKQTNTHN